MIDALPITCYVQSHRGGVLQICRSVDMSCSGHGCISATYEPLRLRALYIDARLGQLEPAAIGGTYVHERPGRVKTAAIGVPKAQPIPATPIRSNQSALLDSAGLDPIGSTPSASVDRNVVSFEISHSVFNLSLFFRLMLFTLWYNKSALMY